MATSIANLAVKLTANISGFTTGMKSAVRPLRDLGSNITSIGTKIIGFGSALTALAAGAGMVALVKNSMEAIDATAKLSDRLGIATEKMVGLQHAANLSGVSDEALTGGLEKMLKSLSEAATKGGAAGAAFAKLGLDARQLASAAPDEAFTAIAEGLKGIQNPAERAALAMQIFGKSGQGLLPLMLSGKDGIAAAQAEAEKLGLTFSRVDAAKVEAANDAMTRLQALFIGAARTLAIQLAPFIDALATKLTAVGSSGEGMGSKIVTAVEWTLKALAYAAQAVDALRIAGNAIGIAMLWAFEQSIEGAEMFAKAVTWVVNKAIDVVNTLIRALNKIPKVNIAEIDFKLATDTGMSDAVQGISKLVRAEMAKEIESLSAFDRAEKVGKFFDDLRSKAQENAQAVADNADKMRGAAFDTEDWADKLKQAEENAKKVTDTLADLQKQVDQFGMTDSQKKVADLAALGGTPEQLEQAKKALAQLDALNAAKKESEAMQERAKSVLDSIQTPTEKYDKTIGELSELLSAGMLTWDQYGRAVRKARDELEKSAEVEPPGAPELFRAGSAAAQRFAFESTRGIQRLTKDDLQKKALAEAQGGNRLLDRIERNTRRGGTDEVTTLGI